MSDADERSNKSDDDLPEIDDIQADADDLFGDEEEDEDQDVAPTRKSRTVRAATDPSDEELASELDDELEDEDGRDARRAAPTTKLTRVLEVSLLRHGIPPTKGKNLQSLRVPNFIKFIPEEYDGAAFAPSEWDLANAKADRPVPAVRFRRDPKSSGHKLQSNAYVYKWSDGSSTVAIGDTHYALQTKPLVPDPNGPYVERRDANYYAAAAHLASNILMVVGHVTAQHTVKPPKDVDDDAIKMLTQRLVAERKADTEIVTVTTDPEAMKKAAETAAREALMARRKLDRETQREEAKQYTRRRYDGGGLSLMDLEGGGGGTRSRKRNAPGASTRRSRRTDYDTDEDLPAGGGRNEYEKDDWLVSDEEEEESAEGGDDDEEDILDDEDEDGDDQNRKSKSRSKKDKHRPRAKRRKTSESEEDEDEDADADADADADMDDAPPSRPAEQAGRGRRRVIDDDDDDE